MGKTHLRQIIMKESEKMTDGIRRIIAAWNAH